MKQVLLAALVAAGAAHADPISYYFWETASGTFTDANGTSSFTDQVLQVQIDADTANVAPVVPGNPLLLFVDGIADVTIGGNALGTFVDPGRVTLSKDGSPSAVAFRPTSITTSQQLAVLNTTCGLGYWTMQVSIGPCKGGDYRTADAWVLDTGTLQITASNGLWFQAVGPVGPIPEPSTALLACLGLPLLGLAVRRRA